MSVPVKSPNDLRMQLRAAMMANKNPEERMANALEVIAEALIEISLKK